MKTTIVARVVRVLVGHSPTAMIHARQEGGHEHKIEVPVEAVRNVSPGQVLVLEWSIHSLPELAPGVTASEVVDATFSERPLEAPTSGQESARPTQSTNHRSEAMALEAALGLKPGRLTTV